MAVETAALRSKSRGLGVLMTTKLQLTNLYMQDEQKFASKILSP